MGKVTAQLFSGVRVGLESSLVEENKTDQLDRLRVLSPRTRKIGAFRGPRLQNISYGLNCDFGGSIHWITESPGRDGREAHAGAVFAVGLFNGVAVAALKYLWLIAHAALPHGADGVDHVSRFQLCAGSGNGLACGQCAALFADPFALFEQRRAGSAMNSAIDSTAAKQGRVGCVDYGIRGFVSNVANDQFQSGFVPDTVSQAGDHFIYQ